MCTIARKYEILYTFLYFIINFIHIKINNYYISIISFYKQSIKSPRLPHLVKIHLFFLIIFFFVGSPCCVHYEYAYVLRCVFTKMLLQKELN